MTFEEWLRLIVPLAIGWIFWAAFFRRKTRKLVADGPISEPYSIYTTEFDVVLHGRNLAERIVSLSPDLPNGHFEKTSGIWNAQIAAATTFLSSNCEKVELSAQHALANTAAIFLVDQSGSMKGEPIAWAAAGVRKLADQFLLAGASVEVVGFSTAGWRGGFARQKWTANKKPKRPGRLCALMHVIYLSFDEAEWNDQSWEAMLNPNVLRENVDGETLLWAANKLKSRQENRRILVIVSDGAPVDDSTLMENGEGYLWRHLQKVVSDMQMNDDIELLAVGVNHRVDEIYQRSAVIQVGENLSATVWDLMR